MISRWVVVTLAAKYWVTWHKVLSGKSFFSRIIVFSSYIFVLKFILCKREKIPLITNCIVYLMDNIYSNGPVSYASRTSEGKKTERLQCRAMAAYQTKITCQPEHDHFKAGYLTKTSGFVLFWNQILAVRYSHDYCSLEN